MNDKIFGYIVTAGASLLAAFLINRFKNRIVCLTKTIQHESIAVSQEDEFWGKIRVLYNGKETAFVNLTKVTIENPTSVDLENIDLLITTENNSKILVSHALNQDINITLPFTERYAEQIERKNDRYIDSRVEYRIPVLNRHSNVEVSLLLDSSEVKIPEINIVIEKKGLKLIDKKEDNEADLGVKVIILGAFIYSCLFAILYFGYDFNSTNALVLFIVGITNIFVGAIVYHSFKWLKQIFK